MVSSQVPFCCVTSVTVTVVLAAIPRVKRTLASGLTNVVSSTEPMPRPPSVRSRWSVGQAPLLARRDRVQLDVVLLLQPRTTCSDQEIEDLLGGARRR